MSDTMIGLVAVEARMAMPKDGDFQAKIEAAMQSAANHWMVLDPQLQFKGALAALLTEYPEGSPEGDRLRVEVKALGKVSALIAAAQAGLSVSFGDDDVPDESHEPVGLMTTWRRLSTA